MSDTTTFHLPMSVCCSSFCGGFTKGLDAAFAVLPRTNEGWFACTFESSLGVSSSGVNFIFLMHKLIV